jgi:UDPglucose 6-dehydrogenase
MELAERITVIGSGYVGLTTGACLASLGHTVTCIDRDELTIATLRTGHSHLAEPGIESLLREGLDANRLQFDTASDEAVTTASLVMLCLPTPPARDGSVDLTAIRDTVLRIRDLLPAGAVVVTKSTTPVGTIATIGCWLQRNDIAVVANPEFLREGHAVYDFLHPTRIVIGSDDHAAAKRVAALYDAIRTEVIIAEPATAELVKYAANCYLATKLSYSNSVAELCEAFNADHSDIAYILGADPRIGSDYLKPGPGWGGPCLPKDLHALARQAHDVGVPFPILEATISSNQHHLERIIRRLQEELGQELGGIRIALLGLTFKADTDDLRNSPAMHVAHALIEQGAHVTAHDPAIKDQIPVLRVVPTVQDAAAQADALVLLTDWPEYRLVGWTAVAALMAGQLVFDTRNALDPEVVAAAGLRYVRVGSRRAWLGASVGPLPSPVRAGDVAR